MRDTTARTYPASYSEVCDTFRPRLAGARRTDSGRKRFIHLLVPSPVRRRFVTEHVSEGRPAFEVFKAQVDANTTLHRPRLGLSDFHDNAQEPMPACIAGEVRSILNLAVRQRPREEYPKGVSCKAKGIPFALKVPAFERHPTQGAPAPPPQERAVLLTARLGVLFTHGVDGARVQDQFLAASRRQPIKIKAARPALIPFQRLLLSLVAEIPDEVAGTSLAVEQSSQRFDAISIDQQHQRKLVHIGALNKILKLAETSTFSRLMLKNAKLPGRRAEMAADPRPPVKLLHRAAKYQFGRIAKTQISSKPQTQEWHFLPGSRAGISVPRNR